MPYYTLIETSKKKKNKALLFCLIGGIFGLHQFYVGKKFIGILYLFTFGLFGFGCTIDFFKILTGNFKDKNKIPLKM